METIKFVCASVVAIVLFGLGAFLTGCGLQDGSDGSGNPPATPTAAPAPTSPPGPPADGGAPVTNPADELPSVFKTDRACNFNFSSRYISGATTGEMTLFSAPFGDAAWSVVLGDDNADGYIGTQWTGKHPVGVVTMSYKGFQGNPQNPAWAQYGLAADVARMSQKGRSWLYCNWYDATNGNMTSPAAPNCEIKVSIDAACNIVPAGNMGNFTAR